MFLLATLIMFAALFGLDAVLGAFTASIILRSLTPVGALHLMTRRLETVGFSFLIPLFFVVSGMTIDPSVVARFPLVLLLVVVGILLARGLPVFVAERFTDTGSELRSTSDHQRHRAPGLPYLQLLLGHVHHQLHELPCHSIIKYPSTGRSVKI